MKKIFLQLASDWESYSFKSMFSKGGILDKKFQIVESLDDCDMILFGGGADINPAIYGHTQHSKTIYLESLDKNYNTTYDKAEGRPLIGICRGAQYLHAKAGGWLFQDCNNHMVNHTVIAGNTRLQTPSDHHQQMGDVNAGDILGISYKSTKKIVCKDNKEFNLYDKDALDIEIMYHSKNKSLCFQGHPEYGGFPEFTKTFFNILTHCFL